MAVSIGHGCIVYRSRNFPKKVIHRAGFLADGGLFFFFFWMKMVEYLFDRCTQEELRQFACLARRIWMRRNDYIHGGIFLHPKIIVEQTNSSMQDFSAAQERGEQTTSSQGELPSMCWTALLMGWVNANWDAALVRKLGHMGLSVS
jgi:hypothetical protein